jgi:hypothetical protein
MHVPPSVTHPAGLVSRTGPAAWGAGLVGLSVHEAMSTAAITTASKRRMFGSCRNRLEKRNPRT